jgi:non-canonical (house-cleaning) NTP pyrophosphatase
VLGLPIFSYLWQFLGSTNAAKIAAVEASVARIFPSDNIRVSGFSVSSGFPDQPMGDDETILGRNPCPS